MKNIKIDFKSWFYRNCKRQRKNKAKICQVCPFREYIEKQEAKNNYTITGMALVFKNRRIRKKVMLTENRR